jgi:hypothetical protein
MFYGKVCRDAGTEVHMYMLSLTCSQPCTGDLWNIQQLNTNLALALAVAIRQHWKLCSRSLILICFLTLAAVAAGGGQHTRASWVPHRVLLHRCSHAELCQWVLRL